MRASTVCRLYVCSVCWSSLVERIHDGEWIVECAAYSRLHAGFHRYETAERGRKHSMQDLQDFISNYRNTEWAETFGIAPALSPQATLERGKRLIGRDMGGIG